MAFTCFLHDAQMLETLLQRIQPSLFGQRLFRVWVAGCPSGAEPYSLTMLLSEQMPDPIFDAVRIYATDADLAVREQIESGVYSDQQIKPLPYPIRYRYFQVTDKPGRVQVVDEIRDKVAFMQHDLRAIAPIRKDFSLIVCNETLTKLDDMERRQVLHMFHRSLRPGGLLTAEHGPKMPENMDALFEPISISSQIYRRVDASEISRPHVDRSPFSSFQLKGDARSVRWNENNREHD
jgi:chemotaxis protein methyltransferase CheR